MVRLLKTLKQILGQSLTFEVAYHILLINTSIHHSNGFCFKMNQEWDCFSFRSFYHGTLNTDAPKIVPVQAKTFSE